MIAYLTYNDSPSGIYNSQVIDVCRFIKKELHTPIKLVALVSIIGYFKNRKKIKKELPDAIVLPMFPRIKNWKYNIFLLSTIFIFISSKRVIARGVFAANIALLLRKYKIVKKVCYDGRGAIAAEWEEYNVGKNITLKVPINELEKKSVIESDFRIAVSNELIKYWKESYQYDDELHVVIPCTIDENTVKNSIDKNQIQDIRRQLGVKQDEILLIYSGSSSGWQSFKVMGRFLLKLMDNNSSVKVLFLTNADITTLSFYQDHPERVIKKWLSPREVYPYLCSCDYGILVREKSITNKVAAPTKFAEYLSAGLQVIISEEIGDYSKFVKENKCGTVINEDFNTPVLTNFTFEEREYQKGLAKKFFTKYSLKDKYMKLLEYL